MSELSKVLRKEKDPEKRRILLQIRKLNKRAHKFMLKSYMSYEQKYRELHKSTLWKQGKRLLIEYFDDLRCPVCKTNRTNDFVLHHINYKIEEIFTPSLVQLIHKSCHKRIHKK